MEQVRVRELELDWVQVRVQDRVLELDSAED